MKLLCTRYHGSVRAPGRNLILKCRMLLPDAFKGRRGEDSRIRSEDQVFIRGPISLDPELIISFIIFVTVFCLGHMSRRKAAL